MLSLGAWRALDRIPRERALAIVATARLAGIDFFDVPRYTISTGAAPLRDGWAQVVFGDLVRGLGWRRDEVTLADKLWWEFWPEQTPAEELDRSLFRLGFDHVDLLYSERPHEGLEVAEVVGSIAELIAAGKARAWGVVNWTAEQVAEATRVARADALPLPCAAQLRYNLCRRHWVEAPAMEEALRSARASVVASTVLAGGVLSGKYVRPGGRGRLSGEIDDARYERHRRAAEALIPLADRLKTSAAALAYAFALANPSVATVLFGATTPEQVEENAAADALLDRLDDDELAELRQIGT